MPIKFYNTLTREKEEFIPVKAKEAGIYTCGPTVYWYQHIGNLRTYIFSDILKKALKQNEFKVKHVMNVTDVGHLTSDADFGEDKIEAAAKKEGRKAGEIADFYLKIFKEDLKKLNIEEPDIWCKATEHIKEQIEMVKKIEEKGISYRTKDGIYFDTSKINNYGAFKRQSVEEMVQGERVETDEKKNTADFALWKFSEKPGLRQQEWESPWGTGFPGWHLECSAMSMKYLGETFDIHTGGIDHIPVHHTNEIAQSEAATGKKTVNYWLHGGFLTFKGEKVSKSKGGLFTVTELEKMNFSPLSYRYLVLTAHYRTQLNFSVEILEGARNSYERLKNIIPELKEDGKTNEKYIKDFNEAVNDDLDMPKALSVLWQLLRDKNAEGKLNTVKEMDRVFCLDLAKKEEKQDISKEQQGLIDERQKARALKDWKKADELRKELEKQGIILEDSAGGIKVTKRRL